MVRLTVIQEVCGTRCLGHAGNAGGCCQVADRDWILGPLDRVDAVAMHTHASVQHPVIGFEEGSRLFPNRPAWQDPHNYPALRVTADGAHACVFYDRAIGCTVYDTRPAMCRNYECDHLRAELERAPRHGEQAPHRLSEPDG